jgi:hypothetical protein
VNGDLLATLEHTESVCALCTDATGGILASGDETGVIQLTPVQAATV